MTHEPEACECGQPGKHPYPIGGGWALACDECRKASEQDAATQPPGEGVPPDKWDAWHAAAIGDCPWCGEPLDGKTAEGEVCPDCRKEPFAHCHRCGWHAGEA